MLLLLPLAALLGWSAPGQPSGPGARPPEPDPPAGASLLEFKLELASDSNPYLHLTPDGVFVYLRNLLLRKLPVNRLEADPALPLRMSRVAAWWPEFTPPKRTGEASVEPLEEIVRVEDMPARFWIALINGTIIHVFPSSSDDEADPAIPTEFLRVLKEEAEPPVDPSSLLKLGTPEAQQIYWLLHKDTGIIY